MSWFSKLFRSSQHIIEKELEDLYTEFYHGFSGESLEQTRILVKDAIKMCKEQGRKEGTADLDKNFGTFILAAAEESHPRALNIIKRARDDGAKDEDIEEWWNLSDLERRMVVWSEQVLRYATFLSAKKDEGLSSDDAMVKVRKLFPMYGDSDDTRHASGDDRPLRQELRGRVDKYREKYGAEAILKKASEYTTYNAFIRAEIKRGNL
jgi:hypothetical protein